MTICPGTVLLVFMVSLWIIASWTLRQCERLVRFIPSLLLMVYQLYNLCTDSVSEKTSRMLHTLLLRFNFILSFLFSSIQVSASIVLFTCHKRITLRSFHANCLRISPVFCDSGHAIAFVLWRCKYLFRFLPTIFLF